MGPLTFEQVKKAGRFAAIGWSKGEPRFEGTDAWWFSNGTIYSAVWSPGSVSVVSAENAPENGWYHLPDCDCEFCKEAT
jgi:hypothetical protein